MSGDSRAEGGAEKCSSLTFFFFFLPLLFSQLANWKQ